MREIHNPSPQPEDHNRALDPKLEEDPDIFVELGDRVFYQASYDDTLVAIIADYPGLLPASHVSKTGDLSSEKDSLFPPYPLHIYYAIKGRPSTRHAEPAATH